MGLIFPSQDPSGTWQQGLLAYRWFKSCLSQSPSARSTLGQCQKCDYCKIHKHRPRQSPPLAAGDSPAPRRLPSARLCPLGGAVLGYRGFGRSHHPGGASAGCGGALHLISTVWGDEREGGLAAAPEAGWPGSLHKEITSAQQTSHNGEQSDANNRNHPEKCKNTKSRVGERDPRRTASSALRRG